MAEREPRNRDGPAFDVLVRRLRRFNLWMGFLHFAQGVALLVLSSDFALPVTASFLEPAAGGVESTTRTLFEVRIGPLVAAFLFLSAIAHWVVAARFGWYRGNLRRGINPARWVEYSLSASLMIVVIAMLSGIYDVAALVALFGVNAAMILFGWMMELHNQTTERTVWTAFWFGCVMGALPWVAIGIYLVGAAIGPGGPPAFVFWIYVSLFLFFNVFAVNMGLQYARVGRWRGYLYGERAYIVLSLVAKSLLAWQVFAGTLRPA